MPTQTACKLGCKFCFLSDLDLPVLNLMPEEIFDGTQKAESDLGLTAGVDCNQILLISYMGCGEPLLNLKSVIKASEMIREHYRNDYEVVRFAVASLIPKIKLMRQFTDMVVASNLPVKFHLSLHATDDRIRKELMPAAEPIRPSLDFTSAFMSRTGNSAEIHYALIDGVNDRDKDIAGLIRLLRDRGIPIKFLHYNEKPTEPFQVSERIALFQSELEKVGIKTEYYHPPGWDIGSSCGQFLMEHYLKLVKQKK